MAEKNLEAVRKSFSRQAAGFDDPSRNFSRADYLRHLVEVLELGGDECVLEVAAGTCACGRALALHHIDDPGAAVLEMVRVVRPGGRVMVIDMVADEQTRMERDRIERLRDPSHVRCLTHDELGAMLVETGLCVASVEVTPMEQRLEPWLELTGTPDHDAREISRSLHTELAGGSPTGFSPGRAPLAA